MSSLVSTILNSLPIMFDIMILFGFMLLMFGTIATQLFGGKLSKRCKAKNLLGVMSEKLGPDQVEVYCNKDEDCELSTICRPSKMITNNKTAEALRLKK